MYKNCVHFSRDFADSIHKELFDLIWYRNKRKVDHPSDTAHGGHKDIMDGVAGALYNAKNTKEIMYNPNDILNLSQFNSDSDLSNYALMPTDDLDDETLGIKRVSLDDLENPYRYLQQ